MSNYLQISDKIKAWTRYVPFDEEAQLQVRQMASLILKQTACLNRQFV